MEKGKPTMGWVEPTPDAAFFLILFFKEIYCAESIYSVYKDKLQNCSCNQFE